MDNHVRIIAGLWRGKHIPVSNNTLVRPTGDRIRETLFNWLGKKVHQAHCLDLFCGSGILGLEALSRGAAALTFVDNDAKVIAQLKKTLQQLPSTKNPPLLQMLQQDALLPIKNTAYDIIFLDPPFNSELLAQCIPLLKQYGYEKIGTVIYIEMPLKHTITLPEHWRLLKQGQAGQVHYQLLEVT